MVMHSRTSGQRGFMTAESLTSLFFYIIMVAAIAGVAAMLLTKTAGAKGAAAVAIARANISGQGNLMDYITAGTLPTDDATHKIANAAGVIPGVGTISFVAMPAASSVKVGISVAGITSPDVCRAIGSVGFGTWEGAGIQAAALSAAGTIAATPATISTSGTIVAGHIGTKTVLEAACKNIGKVALNAGAAVVFITK